MTEPYLSDKETQDGLNEYVRRAAATDIIDDEEEAIKIGLLGIAGEAGSLVSEAKKCFRDNGNSLELREYIIEELGDLLWYIAFVARRLEIDLNKVVENNLSKVDQLWSATLPDLPDYDNHDYEPQKFPRKMIIRFEEDRSGVLPIMRMIPQGELAQRINNSQAICQIGNDLDDNTLLNDGYRYHDIIHLGHATVLGWSPVLRALIGAKRRCINDYDRVQDGARAVAIEESLVAFIFNYLEPYDFATKKLSWCIYKHILRTVKGLEVENQPISAWRHAYTQAFDIFTRLRDQGGGIVECDLDERRLVILD